VDSSNEHVVHVLNSLIETTLDSVNGYKEAAEHTENPRFKSMFTERSAKRMELARRLQSEVRSFGGEPEDDQSMIGKLHNKFVGLKDAVTGGGNDKSVIDEVERGEDVIKAKYENAVDDSELPPTVRELVSSGYQSVKADHDEVSRIKHQMH
jgi:uncharacterized protein (TIGR02284 family)